MSKRSTYSVITPLPATISREDVVDLFHDHSAMITLNPLVIDHQPTLPHPHCPDDESDCAWYEITDKVSYLPCGLLSGKVSYKACFHDLPRGLQTHVYAPAGLDIRSKWSVNGSLQGEKKEPQELGMSIPREGLYIREDVDMRCSFLLTAYVKRNLKGSHGLLVKQLITRADAAGDKRSRNPILTQSKTETRPQNVSDLPHPDVGSRLVENTSGSRASSSSQPRGQSSNPSSVPIISGRNPADYHIAATRNVGIPSQNTSPASEQPYIPYASTESPAAHPEQQVSAEGQSASRPSQGPTARHPLLRPRYELE